MKQKEKRVGQRVYMCGAKKDLGIFRSKSRVVSNKCGQTNERQQTTPIVCTNDGYENND